MGWSDKHLLIGQAYSDEDDMNHIRWLSRAFADPRYIRVDGRPLFLIYRSARLPNPKRTTDRWREEAVRLGIGDLYLCHIENIHGEGRVDPKSIGFDAAVEFQPKLSALRPPLVARVKGKLLPHRQNFQVNSYAELVKQVSSRAACPIPSLSRYLSVLGQYVASAKQRPHAERFDSRAL